MVWSGVFHHASQQRAGGGEQRFRRPALPRILAVLLGLGLIIGPASAASAAPATKDILAGPLAPFGYVHSADRYGYGAAAPASRTITIGPLTRTIRLESSRFYPTSTFAHSVTCTATNAAGASILTVEKVSTSTGFPGVALLPVRSGAISVLSGRAYTIHCVIQGNNDRVDLSWQLRSALSIRTVLTVREDPAKLVRSNEIDAWTGPFDDGSNIAPGDRVRLVSEPGYWRPAGVTPGPVTVVLRRLGTDVAASGIALSPDASVLSFDAPPFPPSDSVQIFATSNWTLSPAGSTPVRTAGVTWSGNTDVVAIH